MTLRANRIVRTGFALAMSAFSLATAPAAAAGGDSLIRGEAAALSRDQSATAAPSWGSAKPDDYLGPQAAPLAGRPRGSTLLGSGWVLAPDLPLLQPFITSGFAQVPYAANTEPWSVGFRMSLSFSI